MRRLLAITALVFATGCGSELPAPEIFGVSPETVTQGYTGPITLDVEAVYPTFARYGAHEIVVDTQVVVTVAGVPLNLPEVTPEGDIIGLAPFILPAGRQDVRLTLADGREAFRTEALEILPGAFADSLSIDPIADQQQNVPFTITVRAQGGMASSFDGVVELTVNKGGIAPTISDPFTAGVLQQQVRLTAPNAEAVITVRDAAGHTAMSNVFRVQ